MNLSEDFDIIIMAEPMMWIQNETYTVCLFWSNLRGFHDFSVWGFFFLSDFIYSVVVNAVSFSIITEKKDEVKYWSTWFMCRCLSIAFQISVYISIWFWSERARVRTTLCLRLFGYCFIHIYHDPILHMKTQVLSVECKQSFLFDVKPQKCVFFDQTKTKTLN